MNDKLLRIYLNDHLAGATLGVGLARRAASNNKATTYAGFLTEIERQIEEDKEALERLMDTLGMPKDPIKQGVAWVAEKVGRLKLNGQVTGYSPLSRLLELEALVIGVTGKLAMWNALKDIADHDPRLAVADFGTLIERAIAQRSGLEEQRRQAAEEALT
jgi:hypothetical protein